MLSLFSNDVRYFLRKQGAESIRTNLRCITTTFLTCLKYFSNTVPPLTGILAFFKWKGHFKPIVRTRTTKLAFLSNLAGGPIGPKRSQLIRIITNTSFTEVYQHFIAAKLIIGDNETIINEQGTELDQSYNVVGTVVNGMMEKTLSHKRAKYGGHIS